MSGFAKSANLSNGIFKGEKRMYPRAMKVQQSTHAAVPSQKSKNSKNVSHSLLLTNHYQLLLLRHNSHLVLTTVSQL